jgi:hypothetical protein
MAEHPIGSYYLNAPMVMAAVWLAVVACNGTETPGSDTTGGGPTATGGTSNGGTATGGTTPVTGGRNTGGRASAATGGRAGSGTGGSGGMDCSSCHGGGVDGGTALLLRSPDYGGPVPTRNLRSRVSDATSVYRASGSGWARREERPRTPIAKPTG